ncbi:MAG: sugar transferase [Phycisphaerales bacterium]|nr:sugar transferase [Phycisphaerales bacterium]
MIATAASFHPFDTSETVPGSPPYPTIWGLDPIGLHDRFWAARGVQVVRQGEPSSILEGAELYLLTMPRTLVLFRLRDLVDQLSWLKPDLLVIRLRSVRERQFLERVAVDHDGHFVRFHRLYGTETSLTRAALTEDRDLARSWQAMAQSRAPWRDLQRPIARSARHVTRVTGLIYDRASDEQVAQFVRDLMVRWKSPSTTIARAQRQTGGIWRDPEAKIDAATRCFGPVWVGAGRELTGPGLVVGPAILWDDPAKQPQVDDIQWQELEPSDAYLRQPQPRKISVISRSAKRLFDILFALFVLILTSPLYLPIMLAIFLEDGRPFFFGHHRETKGQREFACWKFRSMRKDAEKIKAQLQKLNQADGPQFFMENDPRLTRVGSFLRKTNLDELPQFWNVLIGDMAIVGPRPSPRAENQFCPQWREARLSVRPGITGLWQVRRTRKRGTDFQEWIKYDIQYVETQSWLLDLKIIFQTFIVLARGVLRS